jgi:nucleosome assembly protein 1-like 1
MEDTHKQGSIEDEEKEIEQKMIKIISKMPKEVQNRFKALKVLSDRRSKLNDEFELEIKKLEAKIAEKKRPLYEQRRQVIQGELKDFTTFTPTFDETLKKLEKECAEIETAKKDEKPEDKEEEKPIEVDHLKGKDGIPDFWFRAIKNNQMIWELVKEKDEEILTHIKHVESERSDNPKHLTVKFLFNDNEFFTNKDLTLTVFYKEDSEDTVSKIEGTVINWNESKDPTKKKVKKK